MPAKKKASTGAESTKKRAPKMQATATAPAQVINGDTVLFKRHTKTPRSMLSAADLWLDMFLSFMEAVVQNDHDGVRVKNYPHLIAQEARMLADEALDVYQMRWPNIEPGE